MTIDPTKLKVDDVLICTRTYYAWDTAKFTAGNEYIVCRLGYDNCIGIMSDQLYKGINTQPKQVYLLIQK